ncbi:protein KINESIN LIGHT CHAIN-RELATED 1 isoform X2 [Nymphaea colorata]|uniref:protein KINESIN LIGHT CHAIN-RELATED 1 isoform X2 n=1 Tax=Nymphaea colorata TaxID=210225 RepID=UPI00129E39C6|nr:protein KINESIN LIGHT CHAIN-RELATED 1 isoform X2 [Nymphaea colorata]
MIKQEVVGRHPPPPLRGDAVFFPSGIISYADLPFLASLANADGVRRKVKVGHKVDDLLENSSPRSPLSPQRPPREHMELPADGAPTESCVDTSIERLYDNVCQMQSSGEQSPSRQSFGSDGEESRIDSELQHLVGGEETRVLDDVNHVSQANNDQAEMKMDEEIVEKESTAKDGEKESTVKEENGSTKKSGKKPKPKPSWSSSTKIEAKGFSYMQTNAEDSPKPVTSKNRLPHRKPPINKENDSATENPDISPEESSPARVQKKPLASPDSNTSKPTSDAVNSAKKRKPSSVTSGKSQGASEDPSEAGLDNPDLGPFLLKMSRDLISSGDNPQKALELATRAAKSFEKCANGKPSLDLVMSLHVLAAVHCNLGQYGKAIPILEHSIEIPVLEEGEDHALAVFSGYMQLGDTFAMLGQLEQSIECYTMGLEVQKHFLGETDPRVAETCRYLAEAHMQALQFDEAQKVCQQSLDIHKERGVSASLEEAADRRLMGLICDAKGDYEAALEHLVLASMAMVSNGQENEVASVDCSIGDIYLSLSRYDEAVFAYQKALTVFKSSKGENHPSVASVFVRLANLYNRTGRLRESKSYCENALRIYSKPTPGSQMEEIASGFTEVSAIYEAMNEHEQALKLLQKALKTLNDIPGQQATVAGIEAQMGVMYYMIGNYGESYASFKNAVAKLRASGEKRSAFFGIVLNQMGLACVQRYAINEAADLFEEARGILETEYGPYHPETLGVYSNLAGTYDAMGRLEDAIEILEFVLGIREEKLGTANPDVDDEKRRLAELLKEAGRTRNRKAKSLETLLESKITRRETLNHISDSAVISS